MPSNGGAAGTGRRRPFGGLRVIEASAGIAASYCGKMFADAGADVVKIEPPGGDPMRRWSASGADVPPDGHGPLFGYLNAGKRSTVAESPAADLLGGADLLVSDGERPGWGARELHALLPDGSSTVVLSIRPLGLDGPYVADGTAVNEFVLQAMCGSIGGRGWPDETPLQAGGRIGEWVGGVYGAVSAAPRRCAAPPAPGTATSSTSRCSRR
ncbi:CoA transferase [Actinomadura sp. CNU-125]|uniref:CoA transferase n=1 Tax=Actinomadura sp. CNU-125 TaxID=1904961 RepID=UPI0021CCCE66|nr:CoA transferase [Actinomadura sp. CNU-125]